MNWTIVIVTAMICGTFLTTIFIGMRISRKAKDSWVDVHEREVQEFLRKGKM